MDNVEMIPEGGRQHHSGVISLPHLGCGLPRIEGNSISCQGSGGESASNRVILGCPLHDSKMESISASKTAFGLAWSQTWFPSIVMRARVPYRRLC